MVEPSHQGSPPQINMNSTQKLAINKEIKRLLAISCIKEVKRTERLFLSNIFTVPKKNGDLRLVINLKDLNQFLAFHHFKIESFQTAKDLIQKGDWMIKLDLKEAYHSVLVTPDHQRYLAFLWDGKCYVYCVLPFGLGPALRVFTKITKLILVHIRQNLVIRCVMYLDDLLIFLEDQVRLPSKGKESNDTVTRAGVHNKYKEINLRAHSADRVSGPNSGLNPDESVSSRTKGFRPDRIMSSNFINDISDCKIFSKSSKEDEFLSPCSSSCSDRLQGNSGRLPPSNRQNQQFQQKIDFVVRGQIRNTVVDS